MKIKFSSDAVVVSGLILLLVVVVVLIRPFGGVHDSDATGIPVSSASATTATSATTTPATAVASPSPSALDQPSPEDTDKYVTLVYSHNPDTVDLRISQIEPLVGVDWLPKVQENLRIIAQTDQKFERSNLVAYCSHSDLVSSGSTVVETGVYISYGSTDVSAQEAEVSEIRKLTWQLLDGKWVVTNDQPAV